jgi:hypothetical protein
MLPILSELCGFLGEISLEDQSICITTNGPDNNPFGYA